MPYTGNLQKWAKERTTVTVGTVKTHLFEGASLDLHDLYSKMFTVYNRSAGVLSVGVIEVAPTETGPWATLTTIGAGTLGSVGLFNYFVENAYRFWKVSGAMASSVGTVDVYLRH